MYFWKIDGDTVNQITPQAVTFHGSVSVYTYPGSHGNLPTFEFTSGTVVAPHAFITPGEFSEFSADLRPIRMQLNGKTYLIAGQIWCFMALLEEDETSEAAVEGAHQEMRQHIEQTLNAAIGAIPVAAVHSGAAAGSPATPVEWSKRLADAFLGFLDPVANGFGETLRTKVNDHASEDEDWWNPASWDWDECLGTFLFRRDEIRLRENAAAARAAGTPPNEFNAHFGGFGLEGAWYRITGGVTADPVGSDILLLHSGSTSESQRVAGGTETTQNDIVCLPAGTVITWDLLEENETEEFLLLAPYGPVLWYIEELPLPPQGGMVAPICERRIPEFDLTASGWVKYTENTGPVQIAYTFIPNEQAIRVRFANRPQDGSYAVDLSIRRTSNLADPALTTTGLRFSGLSIVAPVHETFEDCLREKFGGARWKHPSLRDLWGPAQRLKVYERLFVEGQRRVEAGLLSRAQLRAVDIALQKGLGLSQSPRSRPGADVPPRSAA
jgi:hypothetical protein